MGNAFVALAVQVPISKIGVKNAMYLAAQTIGVADTYISQGLIAERKISAQIVIIKEAVLQERLKV